jgi:hypothetical protein
VDRSAFLADADLTCANLPMGSIPDEIQSWLDRGWKLGSFEEYYLKRQDDDSAIETAVTTEFDANNCEGDVELWRR